MSENSRCISSVICGNLSFGQAAGLSVVVRAVSTVIGCESHGDPRIGLRVATANAA